MLVQESHFKNHFIKECSWEFTPQKGRDRKETERKLSCSVKSSEGEMAHQRCPKDKELGPYFLHVVQPECELSLEGDMTLESEVLSSA